MVTTKLILRPSYRKKDNTVPIAIRITKDRKSRFIFTGQYILEKDWNSNLCKVRSSHPNSARLNNFLLKKLSEANDISLEKDSDSVREIKNRIAKKRNNDFFEVAENYIAQLKKRNQFTQYKTEKGRIACFQSFIGKNSLSFEDITVPVLKKFQGYLLHTKQNAPRTVTNYMILFRTLFNIALNDSLLDRHHYPFGKGKITIKFPETTKVGLNVEEVKLLEQAQDLTEAQQHALNVWLISFYFAGIRTSDVLQLKWSDFRDERLYYRMNKNEKLVSLKVPQKAKTILELYRKKYPHNKLVFPELNNVSLNSPERMSIRIRSVNRNFNKHLKKIANQLDITKSLSMHIARHTFGNISGSAIPIQMLQKLYRHSSITTTINYQQNFIHEETDEALDSVINF